MSRGLGVFVGVRAAITLGAPEADETHASMQRLGSALEAAWCDEQAAEGKGSTVEFVQGIVPDSLLSALTLQKKQKCES